MHAALDHTGSLGAPFLSDLGHSLRVLSALPDELGMMASGAVQAKYSNNAVLFRPLSLPGKKASFKKMETSDPLAVFLAFEVAYCGAKISAMMVDACVDFPL